MEILFNMFAAHVPSILWHISESNHILKKRRLWLDFVYWKLVGSWKNIFMVKGLLMVIRLRVTQFKSLRINQGGKNNINWPLFWMGHVSFNVHGGDVHQKKKKKLFRRQKLFHFDWKIKAHRINTRISTCYICMQSRFVIMHKGIKHLA